MALNTAIRGQQIRDAFFGNGLKRNVADDNIAELDINGLSEVVIAVGDSLVFNDSSDSDTPKKLGWVNFVELLAGEGLVRNSGNQLELKLDLSELSELGSGEDFLPSADFLAFVDVNDSNATKKISVDDFTTAIAGEGLTASSGALALNITEVTAGAVDVSADSLIFEDADDNSTKKESFADLATAMAGDGLSAGSGALALDLNELTGAVVDVANDSIAIVDADDNSSKKETIADLATAMAGTGITATNGVLSADAVADNIVEGDIQVEDESANCNGVTVAFTLSSTPIANSLQVFLNGMLQQEGSGKDYTWSGTTVTFAVAPDTGDILLIHYIINN